MKPILQVALDFVDLKRALALAREAASYGGADWIEAGTPLIKSEGLEAVRSLKKLFPSKVIVADMKTMDVGRAEVEIAAKAGADVVGVLGAASDETIKEAIAAARNYGARVIVDLIEVKNPAARAREVEKLGADYVGVHIPVDDQMKGRTCLDVVSKVAAAVSIPVAAAGGITSENAAAVVRAGATIIIAGGSITKSPDARAAAVRIKKAIERGVRISTGKFRRVVEKNVLDALGKVSSANLSDALHRASPLKNIFPVYARGKIAGRAVTVRTAPGDWAKPVEAIDSASPGDIIVIDAYGVGPAVWGELATTSAVLKKLAGVVIHGGIRDVSDIKKLKFPSYASLVTPQAGEPKGFGEIGVVIDIGGIKIAPQDWILADEDGVMVIGRESAVESSNRAMDVLEKEERLRAEIKSGKTLSELAELLKWEKK